VPFFAKGANWIPADAFITRLKRGDYEKLLKAAVEANMNMLRLWGGGIFELDHFYDLCDELGICIWHDFMFACSTYPVFEEGFLDNVRHEIVDNVKNLRHHPSIAIWCGNNELECGLVGNEWDERHMSWVDYDKVFNKLIPETLAAIDAERDYWPASPHTPHNRENSEDPAAGDVHLWGVWHGRQPFEWYRNCKHRFISEFGFQSFPSLSTLKHYAREKDFNLTSPVMEHFQRSGIGNSTIMHYMLSWFRAPIGFENTVQLSQIQQATAIKYAVEHWRRNMPCTMGALYWQLNDCWCAPSWSSIDYEGRWKALHYFAKKFFAPVMLSILEKRETHQMEVYITSDRQQAFEADLVFVVQRLDGKTLLQRQKTIKVSPVQSTLIETIDLKDLVSKYGEDGFVLWSELKEKGRTVSENISTFLVPKKLEFEKPSFSYKIRDAGANSYQMILKTDKPAMWIGLDTGNAEDVLSDNYFCLLRGQEKEITIVRKTRSSSQQLAKSLKIRSLVDTYMS
jgi:beta-mannosidase